MQGLKAKMFSLGLEIRGFDIDLGAQGLGLGVHGRGLELETSALLHDVFSTVVYKFPTDNNKPLHSGAHVHNRPFSSVKFTSLA